ncbi:LysR family transcriptional regulator [Azospirillum sp. RWY-5-1]|uniref:LysR family transcriptional regulator n=1 Tax=Azospirillum oleiclasticum TaxID=2735135 RepID=A0ABX2TEA9_9PROT|nr:LysR family transcriptional regulator [Azospirillum oleiclasticum]NYZ14063.1 LysR family transcriptional regulator [Azospirillum oleiclasticum]NYZ21547.1 LysR family transcriptional regulator [Azospirillum oleiclasticum]
MTLEQLRIFVAVALREHVTQGARDLNLTQSATSAAIAALEARYATRLFDRVGRRVVLTEAGRLFLAEARAVLARAAEAETALADLAGLKRGTLRLAGSQTVANYWLPPLMNRYHALYPGIALSLVIGNTNSVAAQVHDGSADLGVVEGEVVDPALGVEPVDGDELVLVVAPGHPWASTAPGAPAAFAAERWILRERGSGTRSAFEAALPEWGLTPGDLRVALEFPSNEAVRSAVEAGAGAAVLSRLVVAASLLAGSLVAVPAALPRRRFYALRRQERHVTQAQRAFLALAASTARPP